MNEIEAKLRQMIEQLERSIEKADSINQKLDTLLEAVSKVSKPRGVGGMKWTKDQSKKPQYQ